MSLAYSGAEPQPSLAWQFEGTTTDSVSGLAGTTTGTVSYGTGKYNQCVSIYNVSGTSAASNLVTYTVSLGSTTGFTVATWVRMDGAQTASLQNTIIGLRGYPDSNAATLNYFNMWQRAGPLSFGFYGQNGTVLSQDYQPTISTTTTPTIGTWYHYALTVSPTTFTVYINGAQNGTPVAVGNAFTINTMYLARSGQVNALAGINSVDDLRIYNTALTAAQVQSAYSSQGAPAPSSTMPLPQLAWDFQSSNVDYVSSLSPSYSTVAGALTSLPTFVSGKYNQAIRLTQTAPNAGANTYVLWSLASSPISIDTTGITVACWVNWTTFQGSLISMYDAFTNVLGIYMTTTATQTGQGFSGTQALKNATSNTSTNSTGVWYHVALTYNSSAVILYKNGVGTTPVTTGAPSVTITGIRIGSQGNNINPTYAGYACADCAIDDLRIYNTALTSAQVQAVYRAQGMPSRTTLTNSIGSSTIRFRNSV